MAASGCSGVPCRPLAGPLGDLWAWLRRAFPERFQANAVGRPRLPVNACEVVLAWALVAKPVCLRGLWVASQVGWRPGGWAANFLNCLRMLVSLLCSVRT